MNDYSRQIAETALDIKAIKLSPNSPFTWASGYQMPIYNDNRRFLTEPSARVLIRDAFCDLIDSTGIQPDLIAGTSTAGIPPATTLADRLSLPLIYVRDKPKDHGLRNQIEGIDANSDLERRNILLIEDLISTGGSSARAVEAIRNANGNCIDCFSIFNYGLNEATTHFAQMSPPCNVTSLLDYDTLLQVAKERGYISKAQASLLEDWRSDPFGWGEKNGFPKVQK